MNTVLILSFLILQNSWLWEFKKNPNNPVIPYGTSGEWDGYSVLDGHLLKDEDTLKLYFVGYSGDMDRSAIGYSYSYDTGRTWHKYAGNPVFISDSSGWERNASGEAGLWETAMMKQKGLYKMWYQAKDSSDYQNTLYATSSDGICWTRENNHFPVMMVDSLYWRWDSRWAGARSVIYARDSFYLFYEGIPVGLGPNYLGLAVGPNESTFVKVDTLPVFKPTEDTAWCGKNGMVPSVIYINSTFLLFYSAGCEADSSNIGVGLAFSKDGKHWRRYRKNPVYNGETGQAGAWDSASFTFINIENVGTENKPKLLGTYRARKGIYPEWHFEIGVVTIDAKDLTPPTAPEIIAPQNGTIIDSNKMEFCWTRGEDSCGIEYYILKYGDSVIETNDTTYLDSLSNGTYEWQVQAIDSAGWESEWAKDSFTVCGVETEEIVKMRNFFVRWNPNPTRGQLNISYSLPIDSKVSLKIYDITGKLVKNLVDNNSRAGSCNIALDMKDLGNGVYFAKFHSIPKHKTGNEYKTVRKLILIR